LKVETVELPMTVPEASRTETSEAMPSLPANMPNIPRVKA